MPPPIVPAPITAALLDLARLRVLADARHLVGFALGKEDVALRLRLVADDQLQEQVALFLLRLVDRRIERHADRLDRGGRRMQPARLLGVLRDDLVELRRVGANLFELVLSILDALKRALCSEHAAGEFDGTLDQIAFDDVIDKPCLERVLRGDRIARQDHRQRLLDADEARQPLRAARARDQAELDLGQAEPRARGRDAEMAAHGELEPTTERRAVHRRDRRLLDVVDQRDHVDQARRLRGLAELGDVGARDECAARAGHDDRFHARVVARLLEAFHQARPHAMAQRIHGRIVDGDDGDVAVAPHADWIVHERLSLKFSLSIASFRSAR